MKIISTLKKSLHCYHKNHIVQIHVIYLQCWVTSGWWMCLPEYHTLGMLQHFPSYQNTALKKNCYSDMMRIDLFLPSAVHVCKTFTNNWPEFVHYSYFPSHKYYTSPSYRICCPRTGDLHLLTSLHPIHQVKHYMLAGIDSKSSASGMQQTRVLHLSGTQKTPV